MDVLTIASTRGVAVVLHPLVVAEAVDPHFRRGLPSDDVGAFLRSAAAGESPLVSGAVVLTALRHLASSIRDAAERRIARGEPRDAHLYLSVHDARGAHVGRARVRTQYDARGERWNDRLAGPLTSSDPWRDVADGETRAWALGVLGEVASRADGSIVRPGHVAREDARGRGFASREESVTLRFAPLHEDPSLLAALAWVGERTDEPLRFASR